MYIFVDAEPVKEYRYPGTVKKAISIVGSGQYQNMRKLIKKSRKKYPDANGLIFHFHDIGADKIDIVKIE